MFASTSSAHAILSNYLQAYLAAEPYAHRNYYKCIQAHIIPKVSRLLLPMQLPAKPISAFLQFSRWLVTTNQQPLPEAWIGCVGLDYLRPAELAQIRDLDLRNQKNAENVWRFKLLTYTLTLLEPRLKAVHAIGPKELQALASNPREEIARAFRELLESPVAPESLRFASGLPSLTRATGICRQVSLEVLGRSVSPKTVANSFYLAPQGEASPLAGSPSGGVSLARLRRSAVILSRPDRSDKSVGWWVGPDTVLADAQALVGLARVKVSDYTGNHWVIEDMWASDGRLMLLQTRMPGATPVEILSPAGAVRLRAGTPLYAFQYPDTLLPIRPGNMIVQPQSGLKGVHGNSSVIREVCWLGLTRPCPPGLFVFDGQGRVVGVTRNVAGVSAVSNPATIHLLQQLAPSRPFRLTRDGP